jgi:hypothetical protein
MAKKQKRPRKRERETEKREPEKVPAAVPTKIASMADFWPKGETTKKSEALPTKPDRRPSAASLSKPSKKPHEGTASSSIAPRTAASKSVSDRPVAPMPASSALRMPALDQVKGAVTSAAALGPESVTRREKYRKLIENVLGERADKPLDINLGIDLGTSFSKVVWRYRDNAYPVCFGKHDERLEDYFVPSVVRFDGTSLTSDSDHGQEESTAPEHRIANFKMCLACVSAPGGDCRPESCTFSNWGPILSSLLMKDEVVRLVNATFLGQLIARSKTLILKQLKKEGVSAPVARWSGNLAVPEKYMDHSDVLSGFESVLRTAWLMAIVFERESSLHRLEEIIDCYECAKHIVSDGRELDCFVYPEVGAEVASVTKSRSAKQGLYAFVDIGAGTVDASIFRFHRDRQDGEKQFTYAAAVIKAGAGHVEIEASKKLATQSQVWFRRIKEGDAGVNLPSESVEKTLGPFLAEALRELGAKVNSDLILLFKEAYEKEKKSDRWEDIQLVVGGGGSALPAYETAALQAFSLKGRGRPVGSNITRVELSVPKDFHMGGLSPRVFDRFAVAYGVSFLKVDLPELVLAGDVGPLPPILRKGNIDPDDR